jgi:hypothetical protein
MIRAFIQITNYRSWLKGGQSGKGPDKASLILKAAAKNGDPKVLQEAMKTIPGGVDLTSHATPLVGSEIYGSAKRKLNMPPGSQFDSHRPDKVNYSIPRPNTRSTKARIEESLKEPEHGIAHTTSVLETDCDQAQWHIARLPKNSARKCQALQVHSGKPCNTKINKGSQPTPAPSYHGNKWDLHTRKEVWTEFYFCADDINRCVKGTRKGSYIKEWPLVPTVWPVKIGTNLSRDEVLALEDGGFQLQQREAMSPRRRFRSIPNLPIPRSQFRVPADPETHPTQRHGKSVRRSTATASGDHRNKWESACLMDGTYITAVTAIPHPGFGAVINLVSKSDQTYVVSISSFPGCSCPDFKTMETTSLGRHRKWVPCKHLYYVFRWLCKMDFNEDSFIHAPTFSYNEVMRTLELCGVAGPIDSDVPIIL